ncbi:hypothetical protein, conserved [Eimeria necatrix]|uniref:Uncharacterized protein n=1 Tax=Eimeria necatrix TaxID=51315 RepID=U6N3N4_9EIME|nr:hypothetical protein, conserved [Eimeria necatrix]CDJ69354.1 hypothetical protein, conserved [Eimeria necatrix]
MANSSPRNTSSRESSIGRGSPSRSASASRMRALGSKPRAAGSSKDPGDDGNDSTDERFQRAPSRRGDSNSGAQKIGSTAEADKNGGSSPKKRVVRLTLTEAAEEIKRLRRFERRTNAQMKQHEEEVKSYVEQVTNLKQQLLDSERARQEEKASLMSMYETDTKKLKAQLKSTSDELQLLQETSLPLVEARKLTFKALRKGRALQYMAQLYTNNTVLVSVKREALFRFLENAFGTDHAVFRANHGFACGVQSYTDSHLRLLRQEQLILLAENERLQAQIQEMQVHTEKSRRDRILQQEAAIVGKHEGNWSSQQNYEGSIAKSGTPSMGLASSQRERLESPAIMSSFSFQGGNVRTLEMELTRTKLQSVCAVLNMAQTRLLAYAFRRMYSFCMSESVVQTMEKAINRSSAELRKETIITGCALVTSFFRTNDKASMLRAFWILVLSAKIQSRAKEVEALKEQLKTAQEQGARTGGPNYSAATCRACHAWSVLSSELDEKNAMAAQPLGMPRRGDPSDDIGLAPSQGGGIPLPVAYAPHYFRQLPSAQKRRNVYFTAAPPKAPQQAFPSTVQRARDMALTEETFYRPISLAEGWKVAGVNGLGIGMEPVGTVIGSHATSKAKKLDAAQGSLKGALILPPTTPSSQPLTAAERNDAYMEQLLRATDQSLKL